MAKAKDKKTELWVAGDGKPPTRVGSVQEGLKELGQRGLDAEIKRVTDKTGEGRSKVKKEKKGK